MTKRISYSLLVGAILLAVPLLAACGSSSSATAGSASTTTMPNSTATATATSVPATPTVVPGVCNPADFATQTPGGPPDTWPEGPATGFAFPVSTYYAPYRNDLVTIAYHLCSPGTPADILTFMKHSIPAGGWTIITTTATTLRAVQTSVPQEGLCASVDITMGASAGFPGEWELDFHQPTSSCTP